jgi:hypothetical protein
MYSHAILRTQVFSQWRREGRFTRAGMESLRKAVPASLLDRFRDRAAPTAKELLEAMTVEGIGRQAERADGSCRRTA